mmetsp:Transcript_118915/g.341642  ORF Transcript_118915/g.341642 Transcript_118915/m.341642 type:complete len:315 (-) Transcript_118915:571-1515(-)
MGPMACAFTAALRRRRAGHRDVCAQRVPPPRHAAAANPCRDSGVQRGAHLPRGLHAQRRRRQPRGSGVTTGRERAHAWRRFACRSDVSLRRHGRGRLAPACTTAGDPHGPVLVAAAFRLAALGRALSDTPAPSFDGAGACAFGHGHFVTLGMASGRRHHGALAPAAVPTGFSGRPHGRRFRPPASSCCSSRARHGGAVPDNGCGWPGGICGPRPLAGRPRHWTCSGRLRSLRGALCDSRGCPELRCVFRHRPGRCTGDGDDIRSSRSRGALPARRRSRTFCAIVVGATSCPSLGGVSFRADAAGACRGRRRPEP